MSDKCKSVLSMLQSLKQQRKSSLSRMPTWKRSYEQQLVDGSRHALLVVIAHKFTMESHLHRFVHGVKILHPHGGGLSTENGHGLLGIRPGVYQDDNRLCKARNTVGSPDPAA